MQVEYDDGYAVYLNGTRIAGDLPTNPAHTYFTNNAIEDTIANIENIDTSLLVAGTNVIAVEIHQATASSSDVSFDLELKAAGGGTGGMTNAERMTRIGEAFHLISLSPEFAAQK